jgi:hypothetical protein
MGKTYKTWGRCYKFINIYAENYGEKNGIFAQTSASYCKNLITTLVFLRKKPLFWDENWQKSQKTVIITLAFEEKNANFFPPKIGKHHRKL